MPVALLLVASLLLATHSARAGEAPFVLRDVRPGPDPEVGGYPDLITVVGDRAFFRAGSNEGQGLWVTDGTTAGTRFLRRMAIRQPVAFDGALYFTGSQSSTASELWRSDGTVAGTAPVRTDLSIGGLNAAGDLLLFAADDGEHGRELWRSDGTGTGTALVVDIEPGAGSPFRFRGPEAVLGDLVFFVADAHGDTLWRSDGTEAGTAPLDDVGVASRLQVAGGRLWLGGTGDDAGLEPWITDGSPQGTRMVADLNPGPGSSHPSSFTAAGDRVHFLALHPEYGEEIWTSDGTAAGTFPAAGEFDDPPWTQPGNLTAAADRLLFLARLRDGEGMSEFSKVCSLDAHGDFSFVDDEGVSLDLTPAGSLAYVWRAPACFFGESGCSNELRMWRTDGTTAGTSPVQPSGLGEPMQYSPSVPFAPFDGGHLFNGSDGRHGYELWFTDGTDEGTRMVADLVQAEASSSPTNFANTGERLVFFANDGEVGQELWSSDGTAEGTQRIADLVAGPLSSFPHQVAAIDGVAFFSNHLDDPALRLWRTDGTTEGTSALTEARATILGSTRKRLYFSTSTPESGSEPWISDGTEAGTRMIADVVPGPAGSPTGLAALAGLRLVFETNHSGERRLWSTDGSEAETFALPDPRPGEAERYDRFGNAGPYAFYRVLAGDQPAELWRTDGSGPGTRSLGVDTQALGLAWYRGRVYFSGTSAESGRELWVTDGTAAGTMELADLRPGSQSSGPGQLMPALGSLFFTASDEEGHGALWRSDGTATGTAKVVGLSAASVRGFPIGHELHFVTIKGESVAGRASFVYELWRTDGTADGTTRTTELARGVPGALPPADTLRFDVEHLGDLLLLSAPSPVGRELLATNVEAAVASPLDCDADGVVSGFDAQIAIEVALGLSDAGVCAAADADDSGLLTVDEIAGGVARSS